MLTVTHHPATTVCGTDERGVTSLAARIHDLKTAGYAVRSDIDASRCAVYWMEAK